MKLFKDTIRIADNFIGNFRNLTVSTLSIYPRLSLF